MPIMFSRVAVGLGLLFLWSSLACIGVATIALTKSSAFADSPRSDARFAAAFDVVLIALVVTGSGALTFYVVGLLCAWSTQ